ncbi:MAG: dicarboxylate/amino acid:cation symporter [Acidobacteria bacterium]|nr:MAG: dicarboxylate/amino acid:cation symporter [Acidobacteriota bacterium]REK03088.1 MAG: dicarboxylate/amino acid:cation symporter [Acidobacteriota bacterium]REK15436.1 MAG: dicarboxylate/amino acid:cation symporter [Acidobacteriota bacterium]REK45787.1 MAG: dicarboxylate/amino acid:cation symporter [Acidobacteriota bacterium]
MSLTMKVLLGLVLGLITGVIINNFFEGNAFVDAWLVNGIFHMGGAMFINALKMLVVPLVTFSLICGVCGIGDIRALGRIGTKSFLLYVLTTAVAISTAIILAQLVGPGKSFQMEGLEISEVSASEAPPVTQVFIDIIPSNPVETFANGDMLGIIFYAILVGVSLLILGRKVKPVIEGVELLNDVAMKLVDLVMAVAHIGVFCLIAKTFAQQGIGLLMPMAGYFLTVLGALAFHFFITICLLLWIFTRFNPVTFMKKMRDAQAFAFSTASSNATIPVTLRSVTERLGVKNSVASFTVPLGATINMDGTAIMQGVATVFIANVYGIELGLGGYLTVIGMAVLASIGTAGVPGVGLIMLAMVLNQVGLPLEGIGIIMGVDRLLDMCRTSVNITGDAMVSTVVAKGEGKIDVDIYKDPDAGVFDEDAEIVFDEEVEEEFEKFVDEKMSD